MKVKYKIGDIVLFHGPNFFSRLIRFGQRLRFHGLDNKYAYWNHVGIIVDFDDQTMEPVIVEAVASVRMGRLFKFYNTQDYDIKIIHIDKLSISERRQAVNYVNSQVGEKYDWVSILSMAFRCLFGGTFSFGNPTAHICSGLVGEALERAGYDFNIDANFLMPADIAKYFDIQP